MIVGSVSNKKIYEATTPSNAPLNTAPHEQPASLSEAQFLEQRAREASQAFKQTLGLMKHNLANTIDPHTLTKVHPWIMVATAAVGGFAAVSLFPSKEKFAARRLKALERAIHAKAHPEQHQPSDKPAGGGIMGLIVREALHAFRPILMSLITSLSSRHAPAPASEVDPASVANGVSADSSQAA